MTSAESHKDLVTGGAGFIGSTLVEQLLQEGRHVTVVDQTPWEDASLLHAPGIAEDINYHQADIRDVEALRTIVSGHDTVYHLSSNTENRGDIAGRSVDLEVTLGGTVALLESLRETTVSTFVLTSSQLVYGSPDRQVLTETDGLLKPESRFAAGKLAAEAFVSAYAHEMRIKGAVCRLSNIIGGQSRRGIVPDLVRKVRNDPTVLEVLGDGSQMRSFLHVEDCARALRLVAERSLETFDVFNVCNSSVTSAATVARIVAGESPSGRPTVAFAGGDRGWRDDVPTLRPSCDRLAQLGWASRRTSDEAVRVTARELFNRAG
ncbi:NAD-dependent epimerase/dehydratase family protein [Streptomyces sp. NPDC003483]